MKGSAESLLVRERGVNGETAGGMAEHVSEKCQARARHCWLDVTADQYVAAAKVQTWGSKQVWEQTFRALGRITCLPDKWVLVRTCTVCRLEVQALRTHCAP